MSQDQAIDFSEVVVKKLVDYGYTKEQAVEAMRLVEGGFKDQLVLFCGLSLRTAKLLYGDPQTEPIYGFVKAPKGLWG